LGGLKNCFINLIPSHRKSGTLPARALAAAVLQQPETLHSPEPSSTAGDSGDSDGTNSETQQEVNTIHTMITMGTILYISDRMIFFGGFITV